jgi:hypothetical protein
MAVARRLKKALSMVKELNAPDRKWVAAEMHKFLRTNEAGAELIRKGSQSLPRSRRPHVFVSYSHKDVMFVRALARLLAEAGVKLWLDEAELQIGETLVERLGAAIRGTPLLIAVLSPASVKSKWVKKELLIALSAKVRKKRVTVLPVLKEQCTIPPFLRGHLIADFTTPYRRDKNLPYLIESIVSHGHAPRT